ncbi:MAG: LysM peptidoglycan-binding domain-containing protein [Candidatus Promineifilaceae bacterium]
MAVALLVTACEKPFPSTNEEGPTPTVQGYPSAGEEEQVAATPEPTQEVMEEATPAETEEEVGETPAEGIPTEEPTAEPTETPAEETGGGEGETTEPEQGAEQPEAGAEGTPAAEGEGATEGAGQTEGAEVTEEAPAEAQEGEQTAAPEESQTATETLPATHTVAAGENLYRIGLMYGISWVSLAQYNHITNPNQIYVGQVLQIPGGGQSGPGGQPEPVPTPEGVNYIVQYGDTLFTIGLRFGISWTEIAEANGLVNPNQIYAGQTLKIPVDAPTPPQVVNHVVQPGETLYHISLQYGVSWVAIANANHIPPPFFIYAGQILIIPGGQ